MKRRGISPAELSREYRRCIRCERDRYRAWSKTRQGAFETYNVLHFDAQAEEFGERERTGSWLSDRGKGAAAIRRGNVDDEARSKRALKAARRLVRKKLPHCLRVFSLVVKNGSNWEESVNQLMAMSPKSTWFSAKRRYQRQLKQLIALLSAGRTGKTSRTGKTRGEAIGHTRLTQPVRPTSLTCLTRPTRTQKKYDFSFCPLFSGVPRQFHAQISAERCPVSPKSLPSASGGRDCGEVPRQ